jgi:hypothetical protein
MKSLIALLFFLPAIAGSQELGSLRIERKLTEEATALKQRAFQENLWGLGEAPIAAERKQELRFKTLERSQKQSLKQPESSLQPEAREEPGRAQFKQQQFERELDALKLERKLSR